MRQADTQHSHCCPTKSRFDYLLWGSLGIAFTLYALHLFYAGGVVHIAWLAIFSSSVYDLLNTIWWGLLLGMVMVAVLSKLPREFVIAILGRNGGFSGVLRATLGGVLLDLCSHGILMVGAKLYERGASAGQLIAFLVASPWNSFSLTLVLVTLIGLPWTLAFIALSMIIAVVAGVLFDWLVGKGVLPENPNKIDLPADFKFWREAKKGLRGLDYNVSFFKQMAITGVKESRMVLRWIFFGVILASLIRGFVDSGDFQTYFGPTLAGLGLTVLAATIIEVCSEGSTPIAADLLTRAHAPGNSFAFLMTGVSTDYTEIMVLKETTKSWKLALFLPLITVPQVLLVAWVMNQWATG
jgi:uncharacterized membrane protein YraQ (UPF0718 family)